MFFIGGEYYYPSGDMRNREIENYCNIEGVSLMDIKRDLKKKSIISKIISFFII